MQFHFDEQRPPHQPLIEKIWHTQSNQSGVFTSTAEVYSEIVIARFPGKTTVTIRGPESRATPASVAAEGEFLGIVFRLGAFMPCFLPRTLANGRDIDLPLAGDQSFWLNSTAWEIPDFDNADVFVERLVRASLLIYDPLIAAVLDGQSQPYSARTLQYRFMQATGLTQKTIEQIHRAQRAATLLQNGESIVDTACALGYYDQSHLTHALKRFVGQTPARLIQLPQPAPE